MKNNIAAISIDQKKGRIRVYKKTLHLLGDPDYIQLLVNPEDLFIAIRPVGKKAKLAHKVDWENTLNTSHSSFELYSKNLIETLAKVCPQWNKSKNYRLTGEIIESENVAMFDLKSIV